MNDRLGIMNIVMNQTGALYAYAQTRKKTGSMGRTAPRLFPMGVVPRSSKTSQAMLGLG